MLSDFAKSDSIPWHNCDTICTMNEPLRPTVWRTVRALANVNRLRFLEAVFRSKGKKGVTELASELDLAVPTASIYLRALNARGLISARRYSSFVFYGDGQDRSLPEARILQQAFAELFASRKVMEKNWPMEVLPTLLAYSYERRIRIIVCVSERGGCRFADLASTTGIPTMSLSRHLRTMRDANVVELDSDGKYRICQPRSNLEQALLSLATGSISPDKSLSDFVKSDRI